MHYSPEDGKWELGKNAKEIAHEVNAKRWQGAQSALGLSRMWQEWQPAIGRRRLL